MTEAEFIAALRRLPLHPGARGLADDVAVLGGLIVTSDTLVEGVHFLSSDPPGDVAWKLVATNLSDLAAKGARVEGVMLNHPLSDDAWDRAFLAGFGAALAALDVRLIGGDTVSLPAGAPRVLTLTAFGADARAPARSGAREGDALWVTGTIGDAGAGLAIALATQSLPGEGRGPVAKAHVTADNASPLPSPDWTPAFAGEGRIEAGDHAALLAAYRRPRPLLEEGRLLAPIVTAMMDVSDGLLIDAARMAAASGLAVTIELGLVPLSAAYRTFAGDDPIVAATAGDDYQLLCAAPADVRLPGFATRIGSFAAGTGLSLTDRGAPVALPASLGFEHYG